MASTSKKREVFRMPGVRDSGGMEISYGRADDPSLTPDDRIPLSLDPKLELRRMSTPAMTRLLRVPGVLATGPRSYIKGGLLPVPVPGVARSRQVLEKDIRSGAIKVPGRVKVPGRGWTHTGVHYVAGTRQVPAREDATIELNDGEIVYRGHPADVIEAAGRDAEADLDARTRRQRLLDVLRRSGAVDKAVLDRLGSIKKDGSLMPQYDLTPEEAQSIYGSAFVKLKAGYGESVAASKDYAAQYQAASKGFKGPRDMWAWHAKHYGKKAPSGAGGPVSVATADKPSDYDVRTQQKITAALRSGNRSEAARLEQVAASRARFMADVEQRRKTREATNYYFSADYKLAQAQKGLEQQLLSMQADATNKAASALVQNAQLAQALGVQPQKLVQDEPSETESEQEG